MSFPYSCEIPLPWCLKQRIGFCLSIIIAYYCWSISRLFSFDFYSAPHLVNICFTIYLVCPFSKIPFALIKYLPTPCFCCIISNLVVFIKVPFYRSLRSGPLFASSHPLLHHGLCCLFCFLFALGMLKSAAPIRISVLSVALYIRYHYSTRPPALTWE